MQKRLQLAHKACLPALAFTTRHHYMTKTVVHKCNHLTAVVVDRLNMAGLLALIT